jgi:hypothetical protein
MDSGILNYLVVGLIFSVTCQCVAVATLPPENGHSRSGRHHLVANIKRASPKTPVLRVSNGSQSLRFDANAAVRSTTLYSSHISLFYSAVRSTENHEKVLSGVSIPQRDRSQPRCLSGHILPSVQRYTNNEILSKLVFSVGYSALV